MRQRKLKWRSRQTLREMEIARNREREREMQTLREKETVKEREGWKIKFYN